MELERPAAFKKKRHGYVMRLRIMNRIRKAVAAGSRELDRLGGFSAALKGTFPSETAGFVVLAACNDYYFVHYAEHFIRSIDRHLIEEHVHLHLCDPSDQTLASIAKLAASLNSIKLTWTYDGGEIAKRLKHPTIYYAAVRFVLAGLIQARQSVTVLCLDIDGLAMAPIGPAYCDMHTHGDASIIRRPDMKKPARKVLASALGFSPTPNGRAFSETLARTILSVFELDPSYHVDQIVIHYLSARLERRGQLQILQMPMTFADFEFHPNSVIWTAKGWHRKDSGEFAAARQSVEASATKVPSE